jgi:hypothetical protein
MPTKELWATSRGSLVVDRTSSRAGGLLAVIDRNFRISGVACPLHATELELATGAIGARHLGASSSKWTGRGTQIRKPSSIVLQQPSSRISDRQLVRHRTDRRHRAHRRRVTRPACDQHRACSGLQPDRSSGHWRSARSTPSGLPWERTPESKSDSLVRSLGPRASRIVGKVKSTPWAE